MDKIKVEWYIPESKSEITISQWLEFEKTIEICKNSRTLDKKMLEIFCKVPFVYVDELPQTEIDEMRGYLNMIFSQESKLVKTFTLNGIEYGFIPSYDKDITASEHWDLQSYAESKDWLRVLSILYRPITKKNGQLYDIEPYSGTHTLFKDAGYDIYEGSIGFFLRVMHQLQKNILQFTQKELKKMQKANMIPHLNNFQEVVQNLDSLINMGF